MENKIFIPSLLITPVMIEVSKHKDNYHLSFDSDVFKNKKFFINKLIKSDGSYPILTDIKKLNIINHSK